MRDPNNLIQAELNDRYNVLNIRDLPPFDIEDYDLFDDKDFRRYINDIKTDVRQSLEYQIFVQYLRENMEMNKCAFYENVTNEETAKIKIHIHHDPLTLEDIIRIVVNKKIALQEPLEFEFVSKEVMFLHYLLMVGLTAVSETVHQLIHNSYLFVPTDKVLGNYKEFVNLYKPYFSPEQLDILERIEQVTYTLQLNKDILEKSEMYLEFGGDSKLPEMSKIMSIINNNEEQHLDNVAEYNTESQFIIPAIIKKKEE